MGHLYLETLYLHREQVLNTEGSMFCTVAQTGQIMTTEGYHRFSFMWEGEGEVRGIQLQNEATRWMSLNSTHWTFKTLPDLVWGYLLFHVMFSPRLLLPLVYGVMLSKTKTDAIDQNWFKLTLVWIESTFIFISMFIVMFINFLNSFSLFLPITLNQHIFYTQFSGGQLSGPRAAALLEKVFQIIAAAGWPGQVAGVSTFHPFAGHDVGVTCAGGVVVIVAHSHAEETWIKRHYVKDLRSWSSSQSLFVDRVYYKAFLLKWICDSKGNA